MVGDHNLKDLPECQSISPVLGNLKTGVSRVHRMFALAGYAADVFPGVANLAP